MPQLSLSLEFQGIEKFLSEFDEDMTIEAGVASKGTAAAYALVWEYGNVHQVKEGPKTVKGENPDGSVVWLSIQAPAGYIAINEGLYNQILKDELNKLTFQGDSANAIRKELEGAATRTMERVKKIIEQNAPVDSGDLSDSFVVVNPRDPLLYSEDDRILDIGVD